MNIFLSRRMKMIGLVYITAISILYGGEIEETKPLGVVIEWVREDSVLNHTGVKPGDVFYRWERLPNPPSNLKGASGVFNSPFDWKMFEYEEAHRGEIILEGLLQGCNESIRIPMGIWKNKTQPNMPKKLLQKYKLALESSSSKQLEEALKKTSHSEHLPWLYFRMGNKFTLAKEWSNAEHAYIQALKESVNKPKHMAIILFHLGYMHFRKGNYHKATKTLEDSHQLASYYNLKLFGAVISNQIGNIHLSSGEINNAKHFLESALNTRTKYSPESPSHSKALINMGNLSIDTGEFTEAIQYFETAKSIMEKHLPHSKSTALILNNLGAAQFEIGELRKAESNIIESIKIQKSHYNDPRELGRNYLNLGAIAAERGHIDQAIHFFKRSIKHHEICCPNSTTTATSLHNLGIALFIRKEYNSARNVLYQSLKMFKSLSQNSHHVALVLSSIGLTSLKQKLYKDAKKKFKSALKIQQKVLPNSTDTAFSLKYLGDISLAEGLYNDAKRYYLLAFTIQHHSAPNSTFMATLLTSLGNANFALEDFEESRSNYLHALQIYENLIPKSSLYASCLNQLAGVNYSSGNVSEANHLIKKSLDVLESQISLLGGSSETRLNYHVKSQKLYNNAIDFYITTKKEDQAFNTRERSKYQEIIELGFRNKKRYADYHSDDDRHRKRASYAYQYQMTKAALTDHNADESNLKDLRNKLIDIRMKYDEIDAKINESNPKPVQSHPLHVEQIRKMLDPGTLMLSYCILEDKTVLFVIRKDTKLKTIVIDQPEAYWDDKVTVLLGKSFQNHSKSFYASFLEQSGELHSQLISPVLAEIADARRLIIIPDGALHNLPFALLYDQTSKAYLIEKKPLTTVASATIYTELKHRPNKKPNHIIAIGDPVYPNEIAVSGSIIATLDNPRSKVDTNAQVRDLQVNGRSYNPNITNDGHDGMDFSVRSRMARHGLWPRLPQTAHEIERIQHLFGDVVEVYQREQATENLIKNLSSDTAILHIAAHAYTDDFRALDSGLVLTINEDFQEGEENGILHAWEIIESLKLNADLVVLSACQTGLGKNTDGEGLTGLTHAFQFAGARSIMASYWNVNDVTTAVLMERFYTYLKAGNNKAVALQKAQIDLIHNSINIKTNSLMGRLLPGSELDASHPFFWAGFQLIGPWD